uniref:Ig-like domain-containing protein n=1 Tax=Salarias fasciatus TaxID=181472 RepID=A0A672F1U4_SALFA
MAMFYLYISMFLMPYENISTAEGQNATLPCKAPNNKTENILIVLWTKPDLGEDHYDRAMKDGDVSLMLKNVTFNDRGTYECFIVQGGENNNNPILVPTSSERELITAERTVCRGSG